MEPVELEGLVHEAPPGGTQQQTDTREAIGDLEGRSIEFTDFTESRPGVEKAEMFKYLQDNNKGSNTHIVGVRGRRRKQRRKKHWKKSWLKTSRVS